MIHAQEHDFETVKEIFYQHKQWFPHIRTDYMRREIAKGHVVLDREVVITYNFYKRKQRIGDVLAQQGDSAQGRKTSKYSRRWQLLQCEAL